MQTADTIDEKRVQVLYLKYLIGFNKPIGDQLTHQQAYIAATIHEFIQSKYKIPDEMIDIHFTSTDFVFRYKTFEMTLPCDPLHNFAAILLIMDFDWDALENYLKTET